MLSHLVILSVDNPSYIGMGLVHLYYAMLYECLSKAKLTYETESYMHVNLMEVSSMMREEDLI